MSDQPCQRPSLVRHLHSKYYTEEVPLKIHTATILVGHSAHIWNVAIKTRWRQHHVHRFDLMDYLHPPVFPTEQCSSHQGPES
jgi:hypothetical protein